MVVAANLDTSEDELARNEVTPVKRLRPSVALPASYGPATERDGRRASENLVLAARAPSNTLKTTTLTSRYDRQPSAQESVSRALALTRQGKQAELLWTGLLIHQDRFKVYRT